MRPWVKSLWGAVQYCADCIVLLACWSLWIALVVLLGFQISIAVSRELSVPAFVLRSIEQRFTASHVNARFGRATFDPTGGVLLENLSLSLPGFSEPVVHARGVLVELNPWLLLNGEIEARRVHATGLTLAVPAMLAPSGRSEETLNDIEFSIEPRATELGIDHLSARIAGVALDVNGAFHLPPSSKSGSIAPLPLIELLADKYAAFCRQLIAASAQLSAFEQPALHATLTPSPTRGAIADLNITARQAAFPALHNVRVRDLSASVRVPLLGDEPATSPLTVIAREIRAEPGVVLQNVHARLEGELKPSQFAYTPQTVTLTANEISARGFTLQAISSQINLVTSSQWKVDLLALLGGSPIAVAGDVDLDATSAQVSIEGALSPSLLTPLSEQIGHEVRRYIDFGEPLVVDLDATFRPGWKFARVGGRIEARKVDAYHVPIDFAEGKIEFDGRHFLAHHARATLGENEARGSFEQDLSTLEFRFLLEGKLRPLDISGWFGSWWPDFFQHLEFPTAPPNASVDVAGRWLNGPETTVFVFGESNSPTVRGTPLDYARTIMFIRPIFFDALEFVATRGAGDVRGTFERHLHPDSRDWTRMVFDFESTVDFATGAGLLGTEIAATLEPFSFARPPHVRAIGQLDGPASPRGEHQSMQISTQSTGKFSVYKFPAENLSFEATLEDDKLSLERIEAQVANGQFTGRARIWGPEETRRISFNATLHDGLLNEAVTVVSEYAAQRRGQSLASSDKFMLGKNQIKMDLALSAEGKFDDLLSYEGSGNAVLNGAELGEVRLLGLLSELLDFTALRFTTARLNFQVQGAKVTFPTASVTGANSAIEGHGEYAMDRGEIDFNARVYPFKESTSILGSMVGVVLLPLSTALEVRLTGALTQPKWAFVIGPTNFIRSLTSPSKTPVDKAAEISSPASAK